MADSPITAFLAVFALAGIVYAAIFATNFTVNLTRNKGLALGVGAVALVAGWAGLRMLLVAV